MLWWNERQVWREISEMRNARDAMPFINVNESRKISSPSFDCWCGGLVLDRPWINKQTLHRLTVQLTIVISVDSSFGILHRCVNDFSYSSSYQTSFDQIANVLEQFLQINNWFCETILRLMLFSRLLLVIHCILINIQSRYWSFYLNVRLTDAAMEIANNNSISAILWRWHWLRVWIREHSHWYIRVRQSLETCTHFVR